MGDGIEEGGQQRGSLEPTLWRVRLVAANFVLEDGSGQLSDVTFGFVLEGRDLNTIEEPSSTAFMKNSSIFLPFKPYDIHQ